MKKTHRGIRRIQTASGLETSRRRFLKGLGVCMGLPWLEALSPNSIFASENLATSASGAPLRMAFVYFPNGAQQDNWFPRGDGRDFELNRTMEPLGDLKSDIQIISGLNHDNATPGPDGAGDHARANATFLTGARARKTAGTDIRLGVSIDQVAAGRIGHLTRFPSLELSCDAVRKSGSCDSGYSCAYQYNLSWRTPSTPMTPEPNPRLLFERLFGSVDGTAGNLGLRQLEQQSILDFVSEDARSLRRLLGRRDRDKMDEYLTGVRQIEQRIERAEQFGELPRPEADAPAGIPEDYGDHMELMFDLLALAFETDSTRVATLMLAGDGTNRAFPQIGIAEGHHYLTHQQREEDKREKVAQIDRYYMEHFARFLQKLRDTKDPDGNSILHNSMIVYGCGIADGNRHTHDNLPVILAGGGGGSLQTGRFLAVESSPMTNLYLSMMERLGIRDIESFGDSTGRLDNI